MMVPKPSLKLVVCGSFFAGTVSVWGLAIKYIIDHDDHTRSNHPHVPKVINCQKLPRELSEKEVNYCHHRYNFAVCTATH